MGRVVDAESRKPVVGAAVELEEEGLRTVTNTHGYFSFGQRHGVSTDSRCRTSATPILNVPVRVAGDFTQVAEIKLAPSAVELEGIT